MDFGKGPPRSFEPVGRLTHGQAAREIEALRTGIRYHDHRYYVENRPAIADAAYDRLFRRLRELEEAFPDLHSADSPTARIGAEPVSRLRKVRHAAVMLSLEAVTDADEVRAFVDSLRRAGAGNRAGYVLEPKFDGISVELVYRRGRFQRGATRGNGEVGEDISHNLKTLGAVPLVLHGPGRAPAELAVRGEVFMSRRGFQALNRARLEHNEESFANPRNAAAGVMRQLDPRRVAALPLNIFFYEILATSGDSPPSHRETLARLAAWGLRTCPANGHAASLREIRRYHGRLAARRERLDYEIDGVVVKVDDHALRAKLGQRTRSPRWAIAWKFPPRAGITTVEDIVVQVGRTGLLTPVALLRPVDVGGVTVSRATLHNEDEAHRKDVRIGDRVRLIRAGDVIPEIDRRIPRPGRKRHEPFAMPARCPSCGAPVAREGASHLCSAGLACPAQLAGRITHYASRNALGIAHLGHRTAERLVTGALVHDLADLYRLSAEQLESLEGLGTKSARQLERSIQARKTPRLDHFLYAVGIRHVGRRTARLLAARFGTLENVVRAAPERIAAIPGLGKTVAGSVADFFSRRRNRDVLARMRRAGLRAQPLRPTGRQPLAGRRFVLTGGLEHYTRARARDRIEALGGRTASSVSGETDYVVVGRNPGAKLDEARTRGIKTLTEADLRALLGDAPPDTGDMAGDR